MQRSSAPLIAPETRPYFCVVFFVACISFILISGVVFAGTLEPIKPSPAPIDNPQTDEKIELGKKLFFDRRLSGDGTMSCATCHIPEQAFADGQDISMSYPTTKNWRNSPTLINSGYRKFLFYDGRAQSLEEQALFPVMSAFEMNRNLDFVEEVIRGVPEYVADFKKVFNAEPDRKKMAMALASFQRSLVSKNAPLDRYLKGDKRALSKDAIKGLIIFTGKAKCADCHYGATLSDDKFYALNLPENTDFKDDAGIAATRRFVAKISGFKEYRDLNEDPGRYLVTKNKKDWKAFRTSSLREVSKTAPYMHNGIFKTLDEVIDFFDRGGGEGNKSLKPLDLSSEEKQYLKIFLVEALTGEDIVIKLPQIP
ncbi:MAG: cytochrome-c peroxidase [Nitrospirae bacterium]|nr:MAG: cytochrome-c peroxidase [Nitrospirota bacterium]